MTIERGVRKAAISRDLDRKTWADLDQIDYRVRVEGRGEAIAGPFYFGRAFDTPPFFTFSAVADNANPGTASQLTAGIAEWEKDQQGKYVGATLWFAFDACFEEWTGQIIEDFESLVDRQGGGPNGNEIPVTDSGTSSNLHDELGWPSLNDHTDEFGRITNPIQKWSNLRQVDGGWPDGKEYIDLLKRGSMAPYTIFQRNALGPDDTREGWYVSTANPSTGKKHLRAKSFNGEGGPRTLMVGTTLPCHLPDNETSNDLPEYDQGWDVKNITIEPLIPIRPGQEFRASYDLMIDQIDGNDQPYGFVGFFDENSNYIGISHSGMSYIGQTVGSGLLTEYYRRYAYNYSTFSEVSLGLKILPYGGVEPASHPDWPKYNDRIRYLHFYFGASYSPPSVENFTDKTWDLDNLKIEVIGQAPEQRIPSFLVNLKFLGHTLKNYAGVHPLRSYEAPSKVVLS